MGMKSTLVVVLAIALMSMPVLAQTSTYACLDAQTSLSIKNLNITTDAGTSPIEIQQATTCDSGCNQQTGECNPDAKVEMLLVIYFFMLIVFTIIYLVFEILGYLP